MSYSLTTLWHERHRFLPGMVAVAFSAVLITLQTGILYALLSVVSVPIDHTGADLWIGNPDVLSVDLGRPIPESWLGRLACQPEVARVEPYLQGFTYWSKPTGGMELCCIVGSRLHADALGALDALTPHLRALLSEPGSCVVDEADLGRLGITGKGDVAEINCRRVRIVETVHGFKGLAGPYVFCSLETARPLLRGYQSGQTTYLLARCRSEGDAAAVAERLNAHYGVHMSAFTREQFSRRSRLHWLTRTGAGIALGCAALLGLLVGAVVTSQTLYAATAACLREYAVLRALGIPRWRMAANVLAQSFWIGVIGVGLALPTSFALTALIGTTGIAMSLPGWLLGATVGVTMAMALVSGLAALRSLRHVEPAVLLR
jgi:putative ABC transport system permease protein